MSTTMYDGTHSVNFTQLDGTDGRNTWEDWFLIPTSRPTMVIPGVQTKFVEVPGMDGSYDLSDYLTSDIKYKDRSGTFEFVVDNDHADWMVVYRSIVSYLHGRRMRMILTDDSEWYYEGRFNVDEFKSDSKNSKVVISYRVSPFKISIYEDFVENVLWDPFCFERDDDPSAMYHMTINGTFSHDVDAYGVRNHIFGRLVSGGPIAVQFGVVSKTLDTVGTIVDFGKTKQTGITNLTLTGNGVVDIGQRRISL